MGSSQFFFSLLSALVVCPKWEMICIAPKEPPLSCFVVASFPRLGFRLVDSSCIVDLAVRLFRYSLVISFRSLSRSVCPILALISSSEGVRASKCVCLP